MQMASGTPCLNSRWDQPKPKTGMVQGILENVSQALSSNVGSTCHNTVATGSSPVMMQAAAASTAGPPGTSHPHPRPPPPPVGQSDPPQGGVEMAVAMAAKINAMLMAKGKLKPLQPLPSKAPPSALQPVSSEEVVVAEVDINDVPVNCRDLLTKGKTQEEIRQYSGAVVSTKGLHIGDAEKTSNIRVERPLYLHVQGRSQDEVNKAVMRIKEIISEDVMRASGGQQSAVMPPVAVYPQPRHAAPVQPLQPPLPTTPRPPNAPVTPAHRPPPPHQGSFVHTKIFVGLDQSLPSFSVNERVEGPNGSYLQHIQTETGARVFLRGKGSGYIEQASRRESFEPLYLYISHPNSAGLEAAKKLCESLLETVRAEHARMLTVYTATGSTQAYPAHGYNSSSSGGGGSSSSSYSSQSWYGYPATGYSSAYPTYPASGGYWSTANGPPGQTVVSTPSQGMIQYPVCPRQPNTFLLQEEGLSSDEVAHDSVTSNAKSPKRRFLEEGEEDAERTEQGECDDPVTETVFSTDGGSKSDRVLMPPPPPSLLPTASLKRSREAEHPGLDLPHNSVNNTGAPVEVKKTKLASDSSGLVPYGGDSSDEEEERIRSGRKSSA